MISANKTIFTVLILLFTALNGAAQSNYKFKASELNYYSDRLLGDSLLWPVLIAISERDLEKNEFRISAAKHKLLTDIKKSHQGSLAAKQRLNGLIKNGAKVFSENELDESEKLFTVYRETILNGQSDNVVSHSNSFIKSVADVERALESNRRIDISATLSEKTGDVKKRSGLLGKWFESVTGDLFKESDGLKTGRESLAKLSFVDGSDIVIESNTTALIRQTKVDKLNNSIRSDITLLNGSMLTRLSPSARNESGYTLRSGDAVSTIKSSKFWASSGNDDVVKLSNYDGDVDVSTKNATISIKRNQGTIVVRGKNPLPPIDLLPSPKLNWSRLDTSFYKTELLLKWGEIPSKKWYEIEISSNSTFDKLVTKYQTDKTEITVRNVNEGISYIRIVAVDKLGLRGAESQVYRMIRNQDVQPPALFLDSFQDDLNYTTLPNVFLTGITEPDAKLFLNNTELKLTESGTFSTDLKTGDNLTSYIFKVIDRAGNIHSRTLRLQKVTPEAVSNIQFNGIISQNTMILNSDELRINGKSYPNMIIRLEHNGSVEQLQTGTNGDWGVTMNAVHGRSITISYQLKSESRIFYQQTYTIK